MTTTPLRVTARGTPYTIQDLEAWNTYLAGVTTPEGLKKARMMLLTGWEGMASQIPFFPGSDEAREAWKALNFRAYKLGFRWDGIFKRYAPI
ncbi:hypothetical protein [Spirosoma foliorum]|uniref:Uncharacterized protein n=1 Tax=Spirosoma foliorum TaxID=2710596 RepID=A0A7G5H2N3_9BACT|nr:hypothetical protein [Spirosoma foliorum]QMW05375.1 hypothetical protein H3H32_11020 [Spirosoma foliorum]